MAYMNNLREYKQKPILSKEAVEFAENYKGGPLPREIRTELEKYVKENTSFVEASQEKLVKIFEKIFNKEVSE
jgi:hypothetical protein